ncbi:MAG: hypothetical protein II969_13160 [Anaerolineaceae bacterium]|nr:hypothetical protein [Anaerolineaceae bacterium]
MCITEYDEVKTMNMFREEGYIDGKEDGRIEGYNDGKEDGRIEGYNDGKEAGQLQALVNLAQKRFITIEQAAEEAGMKVDEFLEKMKLF